MNEILNLEPKSVIKFFYEINQIPRGSGNEQAISDYLVDFAKTRNLEVIQDEFLNVLISKPCTAGYENAPGVIMQGHMDMVCDKNEDTVHDFTKDPIDMIIDGDHLTANGTTLGADNGIAVAMGLAVLDNNNLEHAALELIITTDEEVGMTGAMRFDANLLKGKYFLNLDSEEEGEFTVSCAGGLKSFINLPIQKHEIKTKGLMCKEIAIKKLTGGHSGVDIHKSRANAIKLTGRILCKLDEKVEIQLVDIHGGLKDNIIPREAFFTVVFPENEESTFEEVLDNVCSDLATEYRTTEPNIEVISDTLDVPETIEVIEEDDMEKVIFLLMGLPNGIQTMSPEIKDFVESSLNIGKIAIEDDHIVYLFAVRSSIRSLKYHISDQLELFARHTNADFIKTAEYPEWPLQQDSALLTKAIEVYKAKYNKEPLVKGIHAGLEPGVFLEKRTDFEAISLGPDMDAVHSPDEWLSISSVGRTYDYLIDLLKSLNEYRV